MPKFKVGDSIKCHTAYGYTEVGDTITIEALGGRCLQETEDNKLIQVEGYVHADDKFVLPYCDEVFWELEDEFFKRTIPEPPTELECFFMWLSKQPNLSDEEFNLIRRFGWFKNNKECE